MRRAARRCARSWARAWALDLDIPRERLVALMHPGWTLSCLYGELAPALGRLPTPDEHTAFGELVQARLLGRAP